jgi:hypothetical protein
MQVAVQKVPRHVDEQILRPLDGMKTFDVIPHTIDDISRYREEFDTLS